MTRRETLIFAVLFLASALLAPLALAAVGTYEVALKAASMWTTRQFVKAGTF